MADLVEMIKAISVDAVHAEVPMALLFGTVKKTYPLTVKINETLTLSTENLILPKHLQPKTEYVGIKGTTATTKIEYPPFESLSHSHGIGNECPIQFKIGEYDVTIAGETTDETTFYFPDFPPNYHQHAVELGTYLPIREALSNGDKLALLRMQGGQQYFVLGVVS